MLSCQHNQYCMPHICDWICKKVHCMHNYKYFEIIFNSRMHGVACMQLSTNLCTINHDTSMNT